MGLVFCRYVPDPDVGQYRGEDCVFGLHGGKEKNGAVCLQLRLWPPDEPVEWPVRGVMIPVIMGDPRFYRDELLTFGVRRVSPGLWHLDPSLNIPGQIHVFVVLYDVPTPAPWENQIIRPNDPPLGICDYDSTPHWVGCGNHNEMLTPCRNWRRA